MKFSDALRGAADRAPVEQMHVSTADATGRVRRARAVRVGANGLMGAGAAAVIAVGAFGPFGFGFSSNDEAGMAEPAMEGSANMYSEADGMEDSAAGGAEDTLLAEQWMCGADFDPNDGAWTWGDTSGVTFTVEQPEFDEPDWWLPGTLEAYRPVDLISSADYVITWDGIVVGRLINGTPVQYGPADEPSLPAGEVYERLEPGTDFETLEQWTTLNLVNCWDGEALPGGEYEVHQAWTLAYGADAAESDMPELFRVGADPVTLTVPGDPVEDPFGKYLDGDTPVEPVPLPGPDEPLPLPEGSLTPDIARELFDANATEARWDMAEGTQRWVVVNDSTASEDLWAQAFYGCSWDGLTGATFPTRSAELSLIDTTVDLPSRIGVSYGFVVDDNPLVRSTVTNVSDYTIPGFHSAQPQLFLVKDGEVVAESYPVAINPDGPGAMAEGLEPGDSVSDELLWRDVSACHLDSGPRGVTAGTYTVLALQTISVSGSQSPTYFGQIEPHEEGSAMFGSGAESGEARFDDRAAGFSELTIGDGPEPDMEILPAPDQMDWVELQGWTSLGTITVD